MCIQCHSGLSNEHVLADINKAINRPASDFSKYNSTSIRHIIYACIGINGAECQKRAKILLGLFRDWYMGTSHRPVFVFDREFEESMYKTFKFCPNAKKFSAMCDKLIAYDDDEGRSEEFRVEFLHPKDKDVKEEDEKIKFQTTTIVFKNIAEGLISDPENFKPISPFTKKTSTLIGKFLIGFGMSMIFYGIYALL